MSDESTLRQKAREAIQGGHIPSGRPHRTWGGPGAGSHCAVCGLAVKQDEVEFELEFAPADGDSAVTSHHVHIRCFAAWEFERQRVEMSHAGLHPNGHALRSA